MDSLTENPMRATHFCVGDAPEEFCEVNSCVFLGIFAAEDEAVTRNVVSDIMILHFDVLCATSGGWQDYHALDAGRVCKNRCRFRFDTMFELVISSGKERKGDIYGRSSRRLRGALHKGGNRTNKMHQSIAANTAEESGGRGVFQVFEALRLWRGCLGTKI